MKHKYDDKLLSITGKLPEGDPELEFAAYAGIEIVDGIPLYITLVFGCNPKLPEPFVEPLVTLAYGYFETLQESVECGEFMIQYFAEQPQNPDLPEIIFLSKGKEIISITTNQEIEK